MVLLPPISSPDMLPEGGGRRGGDCNSKWWGRGNRATKIQPKNQVHAGKSEPKSMKVQVLEYEWL